MDTEQEQQQQEQQLPEEPASKKLKLEETTKEGEEGGEKKENVEKEQEDEANAIEDDFEISVGIRRYLNPDVAGFTGILKDRYSDFIVNEVTPQGEVVHLRDTTTLPKEDAPSKGEENPEAEEAASTAATAAASPEEALAAIIGPEAAKNFFEWAVKAQEAKEGDEGAPAKFEFPILEDRDKRTAIHSHIVATPGKPEVRRQGWPKGKPHFLSFSLYKENLDTSYAVQLISKKLGIRPNNVGIAGNKDKRGITTQKMTLFKIEASKLAALNGTMPNVLVGDFAYVDNSLGLGDLHGNRFDIAIREVDADETLIGAAVESLKKNGFINYYGLQRFGTGTVRTHEIGIALLKEDFETAGKLIMSPHSKSSDNAIKARELFLAGDLKGCAKCLPRSMHIESSLVNGLLKYGTTSYRSAFECIPRTTRLIYLHAYQSYIWNQMASERLDRYGNTVVAGDLVVDNESEMPQESCGGGADDEHRDVKVKVLTEEEAKSGKYTMFDVVLPLPGSETTYPGNEMAESYKRALEQDGLSAEILVKRRGTYSVRGGYRNVIVRPGAVEWKVVYYTDPIQKLIETDGDRVRKAPPMVEHRTPAEVTVNEGEVLRKALCIGFNLQSCAYATMCYRELLKKPTSQSYQTNLQKIRK